ncbi:sigma-54-dependent transcriptional regulator [Litoreibacter albidus]|uniref:Two-component system, NtrC family, C4-dicarboxylate transport response regulator DctD n=1 Tax=Litoreibacter albidus TaxID=670155 RepID=A0A1H3BPN5_9RHOB|nr:response regulator [Litoreibacter albidus]SDX43873.1 two-component system, NtrC family, C4-dicarboxylate transport response regulator DctD [Litoreibacter albidus]
MTPTLLLIEDDAALRRSLAQSFELEDITVIAASSFVMAKSHITRDFSGVILSDIRMPGKDGFDVLAYARKTDPDLPVVLLTGQADVPMAVRAMAEGAYDFRQKPCPPEQLLEVVNRALEHRHLVLKSRDMERQLQAGDAAATNFPGTSAPVVRLREALRQAAALPVHAYLHGPAGAGKRLGAHTIHALTTDRQRFIALSLRDTSVDALHTLDLTRQPTDLSIKSLDLATTGQQDALLTLMEQFPNLRVIASSPHSLEKLRQNGLRDDLFYALDMMQIDVPSLAQRRKDLAVIFEALVRQTVRGMNGEMREIPESLYAQVVARDWPDNLPELRNFARSFALGLNVQTDATKRAELSLSEQMSAFEKLVITDTLRRFGGKSATVAEALGLPRKTLYDKLAKHSLRAKDFRKPSS